MAHSQKLLITSTFTGKIGNMVVQRDGIIRSLPDLSNRVWSPGQREHLRRFEAAKAYARQVITCRERSAVYQAALKRWKKRKKNIGIYQLAIMDFMHPPVINSISVLQKEGSRIRNLVSVSTAQVFGPAGVCVRITDPAGHSEEGPAVIPPLGVFHEYPIRNPSLLQSGTVIRVTVLGIPGNTVVSDLNL